MRKILNTTLVVLIVSFLGGCGADSSSDTQNSGKLTFNNLDITIYDDSSINTILNERLTILNAPINADVSIVLSGEGSGDFRVDVLPNKSIETTDIPVSSDPNVHYTNTVLTTSYFATLTLINSLQNRGGITLSMNAIATIDNSTTISTTVTIHIEKRVTNTPPVAIIGVGLENKEQNISTWVGAEVKGLESSYSYDRDGSIVLCKWLDENDKTIKLSDNKDCDISGLIFSSAGVYDYTLSVTDNDGEIDSNVAHITVEDNSIPTVAIDGGDRVVEANSSILFVAKAIDSDGDDIDYWWRSVNIDTNSTAITAIQQSSGGSVESMFDYNFTTIGLHRVEFHTQDSKGASAYASVDVNVTN